MLPQDGSEQQVARILNAALADEAGLQRKAAHAMRLGLQHFTCHRKAERVLDYVSDFRCAAVSGIQGLGWVVMWLCGSP